jgi:hypothetical protein
MNGKNSNDGAKFVEYNDENLEHVSNGPDYGQPENSLGWNEMDSKEYPEYVAEIRRRIKKTRIKLVSGE